MTYLFAGFEFDSDTSELRRGSANVSIAPKPFAVLAYLIQHRERMVTKAELLEEFWSANVSEAALQTTISLVRKALQVDPRSESIIKTYHGQGFRLTCPVKAREDTAQERAVATLRQVQERRLVAVLCVRLNWWPTPPSEDDRSEPVAAFVNSARSRIEAENGKLIRMTMDGFTVSFGLDPHFEDGARRAARCAWRLAEDAEGICSRSAGLFVSFGIETGAVLRDQNEVEWLPPDEIERNAWRLAQLATSATIHFNGTTRALLGDEVTCVPVEEGFRLTSPPKEKSGIPTRPHNRSTRFVGRLAELAFLSVAWTRARSGSGSAIGLFGPAGIGKTRLVSEFLVSQRTGAIRTVKIHCLPGLQHTSLAPVRHICRALVRDQPGPALDDRLDQALLAWLLDDTAGPDPILESMSDQMRQIRSRSLVLQLLRSQCAVAPLILAVEDVHWIDDESRGYLEAIAQSADGLALLLVMTTRPGHCLPSESAIIQLAPLGHDESLTLIQEMPEAVALSRADAEFLAKRAAGNPFFLEELALAVWSDADVRVNLPETVQAVMEARIADLDLSARTLLFVTSVAGPSADVALITQLSGLSEAELVPGLVDLVNQGFLIADGGAYGFRHILLHDTAYAMIAPNDRKDLHKRVAAFIETASGDVPVRPETLAWHLQQAGETNQALVFWAKASQAAMYRSDRQDAIAFARNGLSLLHADMPDARDHELSLQLSLGTALMSVEGYGSERVGAALARAEALGRTAGSFKHMARIRAGLWVHTWVAGKLTESIGHAEALLGMARQVEDPALLLQAHAGLGAVLVHSGNLEPATEHLQAGLEHGTKETVKTITIQNSAVTCAAYASWVAGLKGDLAGMQVFCDRAFELSRMVENPFAAAISLALCSESFMFVGDVDGCQELASKAVTISRKHDFPFWLGTGLILSGWAEGQAGRFDRAFAEIDEGLAVFQATGARVQLANWYGLKADTHMVATQPEEALAAAQLALTYAKQTNDIWFTPRIHAIAAELCRSLDRPEDARDHTARMADLMRANNLSDSFIALRASDA